MRDRRAVGKRIVPRDSVFATGRITSQRVDAQNLAQNIACRQALAVSSGVMAYAGVIPVAAVAERNVQQPIFVEGQCAPVVIEIGFVDPHQNAIARQVYRQRALAGILDFPFRNDGLAVGGPVRRVVDRLRAEVRLSVHRFRSERVEQAVLLEAWMKSQPQQTAFVVLEIGTQPQRNQPAADIQEQSGGRGTPAAVVVIVVVAVAGHVQIPDLASLIHDKEIVGVTRSKSASDWGNHPGRDALQTDGHGTGGHGSRDRILDPRKRSRLWQWKWLSTAEGETAKPETSAQAENQYTNVFRDPRQDAH